MPSGGAPRFGLENKRASGVGKNGVCPKKCVRLTAPAAVCGLSVQIIKAEGGQLPAAPPFITSGSRAVAARELRREAESH